MPPVTHQSGVIVSEAALTLATVATEATGPASAFASGGEAMMHADTGASFVTVFATGFVNLYTGDIEAGLYFYRDILGFKETFRTPTEGTPTHVELVLNGFALGAGHRGNGKEGARS